MRNRAFGITPIELLIVIVIIAILAAIAIPNLIESNQKARFDNARIKELTPKPTLISLQLGEILHGDVSQFLTGSNLILR